MMMGIILVMNQMMRYANNAFSFMDFCIIWFGQVMLNGEGDSDEEEEDDSSEEEDEATPPKKVTFCSYYGEGIIWANVIDIYLIVV